MNDHNTFDETSEPSYSPEPIPEPPRPINWNLLTAHDLEGELLALNRWVNWLRLEYGLPASEVPPLWHRHPELLWELSALHLHWLCAYDAEQDGSAPFGWHRDFADARARLRDWVAASGTRRDRDRPTRQTPWPGEEATQQQRGNRRSSVLKTDSRPHPPCVCFSFVPCVAVHQEKRNKDRL